MADKSRIEIHQWDDRHISLRTGKKLSGRILEGREWNEFPDVPPCSS